MVKAAIAAEEEYKNTLYADVDARAPAHTQNHTSMPERNHIDDHSFHGHVTSFHLRLAFGTPVRKRGAYLALTGED